MNPNLFPSIILSFLIIFISSFIVPPTLCVDDFRYTNCSQTFNCGGIQNIYYPFWGGNRPDFCGQPGFEVDCQTDVPKITMMQDPLRVLDINYNTRSLIVARDDYWGTACPEQFFNTTLNFTLFKYTSGLTNLIMFYDCSISEPNFTRQASPLNCTVNGTLINSYYVRSNVTATVAFLVEGCKNSVIVPVFESAAQALEGGTKNITEALDEGFELQWNLNTSQCNACMFSGGHCGYNRTTSQFTCFCRDQPSNTICSSGPAGMGSTYRIKLGIGLVAGAIGLFLGCWLLIIIRRTKKKAAQSNPSHPSLNFDLEKETTYLGTDNFEALIESYGSQTPKRYSYLDVKKMTKSFIDKLGQGGYGSVYKGKLPDGRLIAVKILSELKGNGEEFFNEVASISKTSHVNVVTLVGFCYERTKRALIYDYMPNGSLDKFIYDQDSSHTCHTLQWETLYQIAVSIGRGLEYLHRGCNTRIVHFDIKPHNILLDENFCPKISDFGLAKLCKRKESIVSMLGARGTVGYIAPEVFCRNFGGVSHKSDVYSYGMMVLDMVGVRKNINVGVSNTSEIYFPQWIYKQLEPGKDLRLHGEITEQEEETTRKMIIVSLWCIQIKPSDRPSMTKVVEMLEGSLQSLQIPPMPTLSSPRKSVHYSSTTSSLSI